MSTVENSVKELLKEGLITEEVAEKRVGANKKI